MLKISDYLRYLTHTSYNPQHLHTATISVAHTVYKNVEYIYTTVPNMPYQYFWTSMLYKPFIHFGKCLLVNINSPQIIVIFCYLARLVIQVSV